MRGAHPERHLETHVAGALALQAGETLLVAASGGPDSAALAALAAAAARRARSAVVLAHVSHEVRPHAWQDEAVVLALGVSLGVRAISRSAVVPRPSEAAMRAARYRKLEEMAQAVGARRIATAHQAEDQTETVLLALFRGTGRRGLQGMQPARPLPSGITLVRPLLRVAPGDLRDYCRSERLPYALDGSNADVAYRRNAIRAAIAPLREAFPHLDEAVARCAHILREETEGAERSVLRVRMREALAQTYGLEDVTFERIEAAAGVVESAGRRRVHVRRGLEVTLRG